MSGTASDSDAETVITEGTIEGGKGNTEKAEMGKVSQITNSIRTVHPNLQPSEPILIKLAKNINLSEPM